MRQFLRELTPGRIVADIAISLVGAALTRAVAWLAKIDLASESLFWVITPLSFLFLTFILTILIGPFLKPRFTVTVEWMSYGRNADGETLCHLVVRARNTGMASIADSWSVSVVPVGGTEIKGDRIAFTEPTTVIFTGTQHEFLPEDWLMLKGVDHPIARGGRVVGVLIFRFSGVRSDDLARPGTKVRVACFDCFGDEHVGEHTWSHSSTTGGAGIAGLSSPIPVESVSPDAQHAVPTPSDT